MSWKKSIKHIQQRRWDLKWILTINFEFNTNKKYEILNFNIYFTSVYWYELFGYFTKARIAWLLLYWRWWAVIHHPQYKSSTTQSIHLLSTTQIFCHDPKVERVRILSFHKKKIITMLEIWIGTFLNNHREDSLVIKVCFNSFLLDILWWRWWAFKSKQLEKFHCEGEPAILVIYSYIILRELSCLFY